MRWRERSAGFVIPDGDSDACRGGAAAGVKARAMIHRLCYPLLTETPVARLRFAGRWRSFRMSLFRLVELPPFVSDWAIA